MHHPEVARDFLTTHLPADIANKINFKSIEICPNTFDVNTIPENLLTSRMWSGTMEFLMRHRFRQHIGQELEKIAQNINLLMLEEKSQFVLQLPSYIMAVDEEHRNISELTNIIHDKLSPNVEKELMSLAEILREEGELQGKLKKSIEIAKKMLSDGVEPVFIAKYTELSIDKIKEIKKDNK